MKDKTKLILLCVFIALAIFFWAVIAYHNYQEANKNKFEFPSTMQVANMSPMGYIDTIAMVTLNKVMQFDTISLVIVSMPEVTYGDQDLVAYVDKDPQLKHTYYLHINARNTRRDRFGTIVHEMLHIQQMETGRLNPIMGGQATVFCGDTIYYYKVPYERRLYEMEAYMLQHEYVKKVWALVYYK